MDLRDTFRNAAAALECGRRPALVTVVAASGSTPGKVGYRMLVGEEGRIAGTVGGGMVEAQVADEARRMLDEPASRLVRFELGGTADDEKGICGGTVELLIETFDEAVLPLFREIGGAGEGGVLVSVIAPTARPQKRYLENVAAIEAAGAQLPPEIVTAMRETAVSGRDVMRLSAGEMDVFIEPLAIQPTVVLFGAGHLSWHIARCARTVHFRIVVCDERAEYANRERFPDADEVLAEDFTRAFDRMRIDEHSYVVIVTRGHKCDELVLERAVRTEARYIGMIGSRRKTLTLLQRLRDRGVPKERLDRVYSPIGLSIGAVTPEEIALSIVSELVKVRRLGDESPVGHMALSRTEGRS